MHLIVELYALQLLFSFFGFFIFASYSAPTTADRRIFPMPGFQANNLFDAANERAKLFYEEKL